MSWWEFRGFWGILQRSRIDCEIWGRQAQNLSKVLAKGMPVVIEGEERI